MSATIYVIICTDHEDEWFIELSSAYTSRKAANTACDNLKKNFKYHTFKVKPIELKGVIKAEVMNSYLFPIKEDN